MPEGAATIRAFVALDLDDATLRAAKGIGDRLQAGGRVPNASWAKPETMHLTLKFAGELPLGAVSPLASVLQRLAIDAGGPRSYPMRLDAFPSLRHARIVVLRLEDSRGELAELAGRVDELLGMHGVPREVRPFRPHVTLARLKRPVDASRWLGLDESMDEGLCGVVGLTLFRSELGATGATHTPLARAALAPEQDD